MSGNVTRLDLATVRRKAVTAPLEPVGAVIEGRFPERTIRPEMVKIRKVLATIPDDDAGQLYVAALGGFLETEKAKQRGDHQAMVNGLALALFALAGILGVPISAEDFPDGGAA